MSSRRRRARRNGGSGPLKMILGALAVLTASLLTVLMVASIALGSLVSTWLDDLPDPDKAGAFDVARATRIYSADDKLLARLYLENREIVEISTISSDLVNASVAVEDERFYKHNGIDIVGLIRAVVVNLTQGFGEEGASTITQQYVRNTILLDERTDISLKRKVREAYLAIELEKRYSKKDILEMYLNAIYYGEGAYGAEAASKVYFAKSSSQLTLSEAALLAGLPQQPTRLDPYRHLEQAMKRRDQVLERMLDNDYISQAEYTAALAEKPVLKRDPNPEDGIYLAPYFVAHVKKELQAKFSAATVFKGGLVVKTTLDTRLQGYAEQAVASKLGNSGPEGALVSIDPRNGYVKALVGGRDYHLNKFNLATQGKRQPGSSFKTFVLASAIEQGMPPSYMIDSSSPAYIPTKPKPWVVGNSEGAGHGMISLASATHASVNTVFARLCWALGAKSVAKTANRMGITSTIPEYPSIALGTHNVTPIDMAAAYGTLASGGVRNDPIVITEVVDASGKSIFKAKPTNKRVLKPEVARAVTDVLKGVINGGTARRAAIGRPAAGKTGTSQNYRDVWFVGYTPQLVTSVWVGYRTEQTIFVGGRHAFGGTVCAPIWAAYMKPALAGQAKLDFPAAGKPKYTPSKFKVPKGKAPSVTGMTLEAAQKELKGFQFTIEYAYSTKPKGTVITQTVKGSSMVLTISKGPAPVVPKPPPPTGGGTTEPTDTPPPEPTSTPTP